MKKDDVNMILYDNVKSLISVYFKAQVYFGRSMFIHDTNVSANEIFVSVYMPV